MCTAEEQEVLNRGSKKSERLRSALMQKGGSVEEALEKAIKHKDKLLEFDKTRSVLQK